MTTSILASTSPRRWPPSKASNSAANINESDSAGFERHRDARIGRTFISVGGGELRFGQLEQHAGDAVRGVSGLQSNGMERLAAELNDVRVFDQNTLEAVA